MSVERISEKNLETEEAEKFPFHYFAANSFFIEFNRQTAKRVQIKPEDVVVDLGCGPGQVAQLIRKEKPRLIFGIDPDSEALKEAREKVKSTQTTQIQFLVGHAQDITEVLSCKVDKVIWANGPHLVGNEERIATFAAIKKVLKPGGQLVITTSFFNGAYVKDGFVGSQNFYSHWLLLTSRILEQQQLITKEQRRLVKPKKLMEWGQLEYQDALEKAGFICHQLEPVRVEMTRKGLVDIARYYLFIRGFLGDEITDFIGMGEASKILQTAVIKLCEERDIWQIPRNWLVGVAQS